MNLEQYKKNFIKARNKKRKNTKGSIDSILGSDYLSKFRVFHPQTLFEPDWNMLLKDRCPICFNKLKVSRNRPIAYCNGVKHKKNFVISKDRLEEIKLKFNESR